MKTEMYKNYEIKIWEQKPNVSYEFAFSSENPPNVDNIKGSHGYEVFNPKGKSIYKDTWDMWDEQACIDNACQEIDADLENEMMNYLNDPTGKGMEGENYQ